MGPSQLKEVTELPETASVEDAEVGRIRKLTEKGLEAYNEKRDKYCQEIEQLWRTVDHVLEEAKTLPEQLQDLLTLKEKLLHAYTPYRRHMDMYLTFLQGIRSIESAEDLTSYTGLAEVRKDKFNTVLESLEEHRIALTPAKSVRSKETKSRRTSRDGSSTASSMSSLAKRKRAKAEAAKAKIIFAEKQATIIKQEAELKAEKQATILKQERQEAE